MDRNVLLEVIEKLNADVSVLVQSLRDTTPLDAVTAEATRLMENTGVLADLLRG